MMLPWECDDCGHKLVDSPFVTYIECPKCESENFFHDQVIEDDFEEKLCVLCGERKLGKNLTLLCQECFDYSETNETKKENE